MTKESGDFFEQTVGVLRQLADTNAATLVVGLVSLVVVLGCRRWLPRLPGSLVVVLLGALAVPLLDLADRGGATVTMMMA